MQKRMAFFFFALMSSKRAATSPILFNARALTDSVTQVVPLNVTFKLAHLSEGAL